LILSRFPYFRRNLIHFDTRQPPLNKPRGVMHRWVGLRPTALRPSQAKAAGELGKPRDARARPPSQPGRRWLVGETSLLTAVARCDDYRACMHACMRGCMLWWWQKIKMDETGLKSKATPSGAKGGKHTSIVPLCTHFAFTRHMLARCLSS
jgi:hypothetical protein